MNIKRITLCPNVTFDFVHLQEQADSNADIFVDKYKPALATSSAALICFDDTFSNLYGCYGVTDTALGYSFSVYRNDNMDNELVYIGKVSSGALSLTDYNIHNLMTYQYYVYKEDDDYLSNVQLSNPVYTNWDTWSITEFVKLDENEERPVYNVVGKTWILNLNLESGANEQTFNKTLYDTLGQYPKESIGSNNYSKGSITAIIGRIENGVYVEEIGNVRQWNFFCSNGRPKILKDRSGDSWIVDIQSSSSKVADESHEQYHTVTFDWVELKSRYDISIIG